MTYRFTKFASLVLLLQACHEQTTSDPDPKKIIACMSRQDTHDDYTLATRCEPLGPTRRFSGTWLIGFELSLFAIDQHDIIVKSPEDVAKFNELIAPTSIMQKIPADYSRNPKKYEVDFLGRISLLHPNLGKEAIIMDKLINIREKK